MVAKDVKVDMPTLQKMWDDFEKAEFYEDGYEMRLSKKFYHFDEGTTHMEIADWFDSQCPNGIIADLLEK